MWAKFGMDLLPIEIAGGEPQEITTADMQQYGDVLRSACTRKVEEAIEAMVAERFLILSHDTVSQYMVRKAANPDRWLAGMRRLRDSIYGGGKP